MKNVCNVVCYFFFFQAEDGIRDYKVTGVQTCALPIFHRSSATLANNEKPLELKTGECCAGAPPVLEFDAEGNLLHHWGGPGEGFEWPDSNHGIFIDFKGNVWIGGNGGPD